MTLFDALLYINTGLAIARQLLVAHGHKYNWGVAMLMNALFLIGYGHAGIISGMVFTCVHTLLTLYGWIRWHFGMNGGSR